MNPSQLAAMQQAEAARAQAAALGNSGQDLGTRVGTAIREFVGAQLDELLRLANPGEWKPSIEHLADYVTGQLTGLAGALTRVEGRTTALEERVSNLEVLAGAGIIGGRVGPASHVVIPAGTVEPPPAPKAPDGPEPVTAPSEGPAATNGENAGQVLPNGTEQVRVIEPGAIAMEAPSGGGTY